MMKKIQLLLLLLITLTQVSCFEIVEHIKINKDGTGNFKYQLNFSQSATKIKSLLLLDEVEGYRVPSLKTIESKFNNIGNIAKKVKGITNVKTESDFENYIFTYTCDFNKVENINAVIDSISHEKFPKETHHSNYYQFDRNKKIFTRIGDDVLKNYYTKLPEKQRAIFNGAKFTSLTRFDYIVIKQVPEKAKISASKKAILHQLDVISLIKNGSIINKKVYLK